MPCRSLILSLAVIGVTCSCTPSQTNDYDLVIRGGTVFGGSGIPGVVADVGIRDDRIVAIGEQAGAPIHFFHLNSTSSTEAAAFLAIIVEPLSRGTKITGDSYTCTWGITGLRSYIPAWASMIRQSTASWFPR